MNLILPTDKFKASFLEMSKDLNETEEMKIRGGHIGYGVSSRHRGRGFATEALRLALAKAKLIGLTRS